MKKSLFTLISLTLLGGALALPNLEIKNVGAEEHTHLYVNGICSCNAHLFEAEDGIIEGVNTDTDHSEQWVWEVTSTNPNHPTSGGKDVEYWAHEGNTITWKFYLNESLKDVSIRFWMATGQVDRSTTGVQVATNGVRGKWTTKILPYDDSWYNFHEVDGTLSFAEGNNEVVLTNKGANPFNIDCLEIYFPSTTIVSPFVEGEPLGEVPQDEPVAPSTPLDPYTINKGLLMEAEYAAEVVGTPSNDEEYFFIDEKSCAGGACIGNFGQHGDNVARWKFNTDKAVNAATISIYLTSNTVGLPWDEIMIPRINGGSGGAAPFDKYPLDDSVKGIKVDTINSSFVDFYTFTKLDLPSVQLLNGENTFEIESFNSHLVNIDYIVIKTTEDVNFTFTPTNNGFGGKGGPKMLEAEKALVEGTPSDVAEGFILENIVSNNPDHTTSGNGCVGNFSNVGNKITWTFKVTYKIDSCDIILWIAPCSNGGLFDSVVNFEVNGKSYSSYDDFPSYPGNNQWYDWTPLTISGVSLDEGINTFVLTNTSGRAFNVDGIEILAPSYCSIIDGNKIDIVPPVISMITVKTLEIKTFAKIEFEYTCSDDESSEKDLTLSVSVYFLYKTVNQEKMPVDGNSFIPQKTGDYTIIVSAEDKSGNIATKKRVVRVDIEGENPQGENGDFNGETNIRLVDPRVTGGWVTFGVCMGTSVVLVALMFVLSKKRA